MSAFVPWLLTLSSAHMVVSSMACGGHRGVALSSGGCDGGVLCGY